MQYLHDHIDDLLLGLDPSTPQALQPCRAGAADSTRQEVVGQTAQHDHAPRNSTDLPRSPDEHGNVSSCLPHGANLPASVDTEKSSTSVSSAQERSASHTGAVELHPKGLACEEVSILHGDGADGSTRANTEPAPKDSESPAGIRAIEMPDSPQSESYEVTQSEPSGRHTFVPPSAAGPLGESIEHEVPTEAGSRVPAPVASPAPNSDEIILASADDNLTTGTQTAVGLEGSVVENYVSVRLQV